MIFGSQEPTIELDCRIDLIAPLDHAAIICTYNILHLQLDTGLVLEYGETNGIDYSGSRDWRNLKKQTPQCVLNMSALACIKILDSRLFPHIAFPVFSFLLNPSLKAALNPQTYQNTSCHHVTTPIEQSVPHHRHGW